MANKQGSIRRVTRLEQSQAPTMKAKDYAIPTDEVDPQFEEELYARHVEVETLRDLAGGENQRGTSIPALFNQFYKFIQNPSSVSVETFKRMVDTDDTIGSGVDFLVTCLAARIGQYQHPSQEITEWVQKRLAEIHGGFFNVLKEMLSASWVGFSVQEKVWANTDDGFVIRKLVSLPPSTILLEADRSGDITPDGVLQYQRNYNPFVLSQGIGFFGGSVGAGFSFSNAGVRPDIYAKFGDLPFPLRTANTYNYLAIRIPRRKCVHYAFNAQGKFGNPYGRSLLRRCYKYYVMKDAFLQMLSIALDRKGTPLTVVFADPNTTLIDDSKVNEGANPRNQSVGIAADKAALDAFKEIHNDTVIVLPGKKSEIFDVEFMPQVSNSGDFIESINLCNQGILRALLIPSLIFSNGDGKGSFALGEQHAKTFDKILDGTNEGVKEVLLNQLIKEMLAYNFPRSAWEKDGLGDFARKELSQDERDKEMNMFTEGINNGIIDQGEMNDLNKMRDTAGFEPRTTPIEKPDMFGFENRTYTEKHVEPDADEEGYKKKSKEGKDNGSDG